MKISLADDFNAQTGEIRVSKIISTYGFGEKNTNGKGLIDFCAFYNLRILNTFSTG